MKRAALVIALACALASPASARWRSPQLELARVCMYEANFSRVDCAAIFWVISKRAEAQGREWMDVLTDYSSMYEGRTARAREVSRYPWGSLRRFGTEWDREWEGLRMYALDILLGVVPDPCPRAVHWGGITDPQPPGFVEVDCTARTVNRMYRIQRSSLGVLPWGSEVARARLLR